MSEVSGLRTTARAWLYDLSDFFYYGFYVLCLCICIRMEHIDKTGIGLLVHIGHTATHISNDTFTFVNQCNLLGIPSLSFMTFIVLSEASLLFFIHYI